MYYNWLLKNSLISSISNSYLIIFQVIMISMTVQLLIVLGRMILLRCQSIKLSNKQGNKSLTELLTIWSKC